MPDLETILLLMLAASALAVLADKLDIPYPILLVGGGVAMAFTPGLPNVVLLPEMVFLLFLPPLLYVAALTSSWRDFRQALRPITLLALGLVLLTTCAVAVTAYYLIPGFSWPAAFVLGAIVSPPDAVAATAVLRKLNVPRRVVTILEGESLVNDASALIAYKFAVAAVATGSFSLTAATGTFLLVGTGGMLVGLVTGWLLLYVRRRANTNPAIATVLSLFTPYAAYILAEEMHLSGVLAVVAIGLYFLHHAPTLMNYRSRMQAQGVWNTLVFIMNGVIFILIGLQLPQVISNLSDYSASELVLWGACVSLVAIVVRMLWVFPAGYLPAMLSNRIREREGKPSAANVVIIGWAGMRGIVSLAAAMALPLQFTASDGTVRPFEERDLIIFLTYAVIFATLVLQGLSLPRLIRCMNVGNDTSEHEEELEGRRKVSEAALKVLDEHITQRPELVNNHFVRHLKHMYEDRLQSIKHQMGASGHEACKLSAQEMRRLHRSVLAAERREMLLLRDQCVINDEVLRRIQADIDLEEARVAKA